MKILWDSFRSRGWLSVVTIIVTNLVLQPLILYLSINTGYIALDALCVVSLIMAATISMLWITDRLLEKLPRTTVEWWDRQYDEKTAWIDEHCLFYYTYPNKYEYWIPRPSTRVAFKLRWDE